MAYGTLDGWSERAKISIAKLNTSATTALDVEYACITDTIDIDRGERDIEVMTTLCGANRVKRSPEGVTTLTFEAYPLGIKTYTTATTNPSADLGVDQLFNGGTMDTTSPYMSEPSLTRGADDIYRVVILMTDDTTNTSAYGAVASTTNAIRYGFANAYMTSCKPSFTDKHLKYTFSFKLPPFDSSGDPNIISQSIVASDAQALPTMAGYYVSSGAVTKWATS